MRPKLKAFACFRPRVLTLVVLVAVATLLVLANLSADGTKLSFDEYQARLLGKGSFGHASYGWPLVWHRYVSLLARNCTVGWYYSAGRLAANVATWLVMLIAPAVTCECLLRRYRPQLHVWSLRTMLAGVALTASLCAWFAAARKQADFEDALVAAINGRNGTVWMRRWGPIWLDLIGADRYRRRIMAVALPASFASRTPLRAGDPDDAELLGRLARLPHLRHLFLAGDQLSPAMVGTLESLPKLKTLWLRNANRTYDETLARRCLLAIGKMTDLEQFDLANLTVNGGTPPSLAGLTHLRSLRLSHGTWRTRNLDERTSREWLTIIGNLPRLEFLKLSGLTFGTKNLACLASLTNLQSLVVHDSDQSGWRFVRPWLGRLPKLPRLRSLDLQTFRISGKDLRCVAGLPSLQSLRLADTSITPKGLARLSGIHSLKELSLAGDRVGAEMIESLADCHPLEALHIQNGKFPSRREELTAVTLDKQASIYVSDSDHFLRAVAELRKSMPGIVIDTAAYAIRHQGRDSSLKERCFGYDALPEHETSWLPTGGAPWMTAAERLWFDSKGGWARFDAAGWQGADGRATQF